MHKTLFQLYDTKKRSNPYSTLKNILFIFIGVMKFRLYYSIPPPGKRRCKWGKKERKKNTQQDGKEFPPYWEKVPITMGKKSHHSRNRWDSLYTINQAIENRFTISHENGTN